MTGDPLSEEEVFQNARMIPDAEARAEYVRSSCRDNPQLHARVMELLRANEEAPDFLVSPAQAFAPTLTDARVTEGPGTVVGPYKLLEPIGEGGFGIVFMAEQSAPVKRKVALKVIKPGMDTRQVIARFEAERQALALMDHPHIAKVFDAGATDTGRPYFVMELVKGMPITDYCDQHQLTPKQRLELFVTVCQAVQHAHQKGIIHRDIKPSNVLVTLHDDKPVVKVIDFGIAKATIGQLTDKTLFTGLAQLVGTPLYMSPEQASMRGVDVDTRSDIYSLGVLLYELLTGTTPFDKSRLQQAAFDEVRRIIREEEPQKPSTRLSSSESLPSVAANRHLEPAKLTKLVRGDLDWIVMKALEKDRIRRYATANGFAADVLHYLSDEPITACPPSARYRLQKFIRRNKGPVVVAGLLLLALVLAITGTSIGLLKAQAERDRVIDAQREAEQNLQTARNAVDRMYTRAAEEMRDKPQFEEIRRELLEDALQYYQGFLKRKGNDPAIRYEAALTRRRVGELYGYLGNWKSSLEYERTATAALDELAAHFGTNAGYRDELARAHFCTAYALLSLLRLDEGAHSMQRAILLWDGLTVEYPDEPSYLAELARANFVLGWGWALNYSPKSPPFVSRGQELLAELRRRFPSYQISPAFTFDLKTLNDYSYQSLPHDQPTLMQFERDCRNRLAAIEADIDTHPDAPQYQAEAGVWTSRLVNTLEAMEQYPEAEMLLRRKVDIFQRLAVAYPFSPNYTKDLAWGHYELGHLLRYMERPDEAVEHFRAAIALTGELLDQNPKNARSILQFAEMIRDCPVKELQDPDRAIALYQQIERSDEPRAVTSELALAHAQAGRDRDVLEICQTASAKGTSIEIAFPQALALWRLGQQTEGRDLMRQVLAQLDTQPNRYWYTAEMRSLRRKVVTIMGLDATAIQITDLQHRRAALDERWTAAPAGRWERWQLASDSYYLAVSLRDLGQLPESEAVVRQALGAFCTLADEAPHEIQFDYDVGQASYLLADVISRSGRFEEAEPHARNAVARFRALSELRPDWQGYRDAIVVAYGPLAHVLAQLNRPDDAAEAQREAHAAQQAAEELRRTLASPQALFDAARPLAETRDWTQTAAILNKGFEQQPRSDMSLCFATALARLLSGDVDGYAQLAGGIPAMTSSKCGRWERLDLLRICTLHPRGAADPVALVAVAQTAYDEQVNNWNAQDLGMAYYRAGQFERALPWMEESRKLSEWYVFFPALAMAHHQLGHHDEARQWLDKANAFFSEFVPASGERLKILERDPPWQDWAYFEVMLNEARSLMGESEALQPAVDADAPSDSAARPHD